MTPEHRAIRFDAMGEIGCIVARLRGHDKTYAERHHLLTTGLHGNGKRRGDEFTIALNPWSHRGQPFGGLTVEQCEEMFGPSYASQAREFREMFGSDDELLEIQNAMLRRYLSANYICCPYKP